MDRADIFTTFHVKDKTAVFSDLKCRQQLAKGLEDGIGVLLSGGALSRTALEALTTRGLTIFFSSHVMDVVERLSDEIAIIHQGKLHARGTIAELRERFGCDVDTSLEDIFVEIVGGELRSSDDLDWLG